MTLTFALAFVAVFFALRPARALKEAGALKSTVGIRIWFAILVIVSLQMVTLLRPMLAVRKPDAAQFVTPSNETADRDLHETPCQLTRIISRG